jgi:hypothetical protein
MNVSACSSFRHKGGSNLIIFVPAAPVKMCPFIRISSLRVRLAGVPAGAQGLS